MDLHEAYPVPETSDKQSFTSVTTLTLPNRLFLNLVPLVRHARC